MKFQDEFFFLAPNLDQMVPLEEVLRMREESKIELGQLRQAIGHFMAEVDRMRVKLTRNGAGLREVQVLPILQELTKLDSRLELYRIESVRSITAA